MKMCLHQELKLIFLDRNIQNKNKPCLDFLEGEVRICRLKFDNAKKMFCYKKVFFNKRKNVYK